MLKPPDIMHPDGPSLAEFWAAQPSNVIREMLGTAAHFALSDLGIRIVGERGTGKWFLARLVHSKSPRSGTLFMRVNCSEIPTDRIESSIFGDARTQAFGVDQLAGILETARGGTVYFDFCEHMPAPVHDKLFRAMELKQFRRMGGSDDITLDVRLITSLNNNQGQTGRYDDSPGRPAASRPGPVTINVPPLRERREDIESLIYLFLGEFQNKSGENVTQVTAEALEICRNYAWPGNIYELRNVVRHSLALAGGPLLKPGDLPEYLRSEALQAGGV